MNRPLLCCAAILLLAVGCKSDEYDSATSVKGPSAGERASASAPQQASPTPSAPAAGARKAPPLSNPNQQMPADHPPVGAGVQPTQAGPLPTDLAPRPRVPASAGSPTQFGKTGPLRWSAPEAWRAVRPASAMRLAEYVVPGSEGQEPASVTVFYFGAGGGGGVEANVSRWIGQIKSADGKPPKSTRAKTTVNGMTVHSVDAEGVYDAGAAMQGSGAKSGQRLLGAIVESPAGLFFFKMVGKKATVDAAKPAWDTFVASFEPGS